MTQREVKQLLRKNGWNITSGSKHDMAVKNGISTKIPIPRYKGNIPIGTINSILKDAGLK